VPVSGAGIQKRHLSLMRTAVNESLTSSESPAPARPLLLLGLGNDILTDDAVGLFVVRELRPRLAAHPSIDIRETTEMGLALLDFITGYRTVVIVDSIQTGKASPGFLHELDAPALNQLTGRTPHFVGVSETLALGQRLGLAMPEQVKIFAIEVEDPFTLGTAMTPALQLALPGIVQRIAAALQTLV
jgi:hydrogenase maturation protease